MSVPRAKHHTSSTCAIGNAIAGFATDAAGAKQDRRRKWTPCQCHICVADETSRHLMMPQ